MNIKYNVLTERKKAMVLLASPELGQDTSDSFESESDISAASAISIDVFAYDKFDIIPVVSINIGIHLNFLAL